MQHYLSVGTIFKDEAPYMKEWLEHYLKRGVDHFYLINDGSTDNYREIIKPYQNKITIFDLGTIPTIQLPEGVKSVPGGRIPRAYYNCFFPIRHETEWMLICDLDEYVWSPKSISLKKHLKDLSVDHDYINLYGLHFGSNGHKKQPAEIVKSFTKRQILKNDNQYTDDQPLCQTPLKAIVKPNIVKFFGVHTHILNDNSKKRHSDRNIFTFNHYMTQSEEKWRNNLTKTNACPAQKAKGSRTTMEEFYQKDHDYSKVEDFSLINQNYLDTLF
jgi:cellulose synthase/poly-beta-1,6-N-acetylglucosamine synthase-like glycosyltransferase